MTDDRDIDKQRVEEELKKDAEKAEQERPKPKVRN